MPTGDTETTIARESKELTDESIRPPTNQVIVLI